MRLLKNPIQKSKNKHHIHLRKKNLLSKSEQPHEKVFNHCSIFKSKSVRDSLSALTASQSRPLYSVGQYALQLYGDTRSAGWSSLIRVDGQLT